MTANLVAIPESPLFADLTLGLRQTLKANVGSVLELTADIKGLTVTDAATAGRVTELLAILSTAAKDTEGFRMTLTRPLKQKAKEIEDTLRPLSAAIDGLITDAKRKQLDWHRAEEARVAKERAEADRIRREAERAAFEANAAAIALSAQTGKPVEVPAPVAVVVPPVAEASRGVKTDYGTTSVRKVWKFEVTDSALVPRQFLMVDEQAIRRAVAEGARTIEGVRIYQDEQLSVRAS